MSFVKLKDNETTSSAEAIYSAHALDGDVKQLERYYSDWAKTYNKDVAEECYEGPVRIVEYFLRFRRVHHGERVNANYRILDVGCGTGLVGQAFAAKGHPPIEGCDISEEMVQIAEKTGVYHSLEGNVDANDMNNIENDQYDSVLSAGVFTLGHVQPNALEELIRITKPGGLIIVNTRRSYYDQTDMQSVCDGLQTEGKVQILCQEILPYIADEEAHYWAFQVA